MYVDIVDMKVVKILKDRLKWNFKGLI